MIKFRDFEPRQTSAGGFFTAATYESMQDVMVDVNKLISRDGVQLVNIETVVLPNIHRSGEEGTEDASIRTSGEMMSTWHQFIRVWYQEG